MEPFHDIDALDGDNQLAVVDYAKDIYKFYKLFKNSCGSHHYIGAQVEIDAEMRAVLADRLIKAHNKFKLMPKAFYLTFQIINRYLLLEMVLKRELQLVGVTAMLVACKYEELCPKYCKCVRACLITRCYYQFLPDFPWVMKCCIIGCSSNISMAYQMGLQIAGIRQRINSGKGEADSGQAGMKLDCPTPYIFLVRFLKAAFSDKEMENLASSLLSLG